VGNPDADLTRTAEWERRIALANLLLHPAQIRLFDLANNLRVQRATGRVEIVAGLAQVSAAAERLSARQLVNPMPMCRRPRASSTLKPARRGSSWLISAGSDYVHNNHRHGHIEHIYLSGNHSVDIKSLVASRRGGHRLPDDDHASRIVFVVQGILIRRSSCAR
jgi:hypothetical protein